MRACSEALKRLCTQNPCLRESVTWDSKSYADLEKIIAQESFSFHCFSYWKGMHIFTVNPTTEKVTISEVIAESVSQATT